MLANTMHRGTKCLQKIPVGGWVPAACCAVLITFLADESLFAQAGGGGGYGGSSSGGGSGGGGGGEISGELLYLLIRFTIAYPQYGIPIWIGLAAFFYYSKKAEKSVRITRTIRRGRKVQEARLREGTLDTIRQRDPGFDTETFLERTERAFVTTQYAWSAQDLRGCRAFISDGVHERFQLYIAMQRAENIRNRMRKVVVRSHDVVAVTSDTHFDTIHIRFAATAISYNEDLDTGKRVGGKSDKELTSFAEIWSFSRRPGVQSNSEASLLQGTCPSCGGPVEIVDQAKCPQCDSIVNSGQHDWVLAEITQDEEWVVPPARHQIPGWSVIAERDPSLNYQHLEDRASVIFWRSMMALYFEDEGYAAPILSSDRKGVPNAWSHAPRQFWKTPAVGVVEVRGTFPAGTYPAGKTPSGHQGDAGNDGPHEAGAIDDFDRIDVMIRWSGTKAEGDRRRPKLLNLQRIYTHTMVLKRRSGVTSKIEQAFSSSNCSNCGAPIAVNKEAVCAFCNTTLNDGSNDWVLEDVHAYSVMRAYQQEDRSDEVANRGAGVERLEMDRFLNEPELLAALTRIVAVDGDLHEKEKQYLTKLATRRGVSNERLTQIFNTALSDEEPIELPQDRQQAVSFMDHLIRAALVDGRITRKEKQMLHQVGARLEWAEADLNLAIARNRGELYQQAKEILRKQ